MKILRHQPIYAMASLKPTDINEKFEVWFDESDKDRKVSHNLPRIKFKYNDAQIVIVIHIDNSIEIYNPNNRYNSNIRKFKYSKEAVNFVERFKDPILKHWNHEISTMQLFKIIDRVIFENISVSDASGQVIR